MKTRVLSTRSLVLIALIGAIFTAPPTAMGVDLSVEGQWGSVLEFNEKTVHMVVLKTGKVLCIGSASQLSPNPYVLFDPSDDSFNDPPYLTPVDGGGVAIHNVFCSGHAPLADGRIVFTGGGPAYARHTTVFDPDVGTEGSWELEDDDGPAPRFYPTFTRQADGTLMTIAGGPHPDTRIPTIFDITQNPGSQWTPLPGA